MVDEFVEGGIVCYVGSQPLLRFVHPEIVFVADRNDLRIVCQQGGDVIAAPVESENTDFDLFPNETSFFIIREW